MRNLKRIIGTKQMKDDLLIFGISIIADFGILYFYLKGYINPNSPVIFDAFGVSFAFIILEFCFVKLKINKKKN